MKYSFYDVVYKLTSQEPGQVVAYINNPDGSWQYEVDFQTSGIARLWEGQITKDKQASRWHLSAVTRLNFLNCIELSGYASVIAAYMPIHLTF